jgi:hypothetical protein
MSLPEIDVIGALAMSAYKRNSSTASIDVACHLSLMGLTLGTDFL